MIGYIIQGSSSAFGKTIDYANGPKKNAILIAHSEGVFTLNNSTMADSFETQASMNRRLGSPMSHIILSFSARDSGSLTDERMAEIAEEYLRRMRYEDTQYVIFRHQDREHPHCHIIANRVNNKGKTIKDSNERIRNFKICRELTRQYGLYITKGEESVNEDRLRGMDAIRYHMMHAVQESLRCCSTWEQFADDLKKVGVTFRFRCTMEEFGHIDERFPDFDSMFPELSKAAEWPYPDIEGDMAGQPDILASVTDIVTVGLEMLGVLILQPYQTQVSPGGGGTSSDMKWNYEDKKKKRSHMETRRTRSR